MEPINVPDYKSIHEAAEIRYVQHEHRGVESEKFKIAFRRASSNFELARCCEGFHDLEIVKCIDVPRGWIRDAADTGFVPGRVVCRFKPPGESAAWLELSTDAMSERPDEQCAKLFKKALNENPHALSQDEISGLHGLLNSRAEPKEFEMSECQTLNWNGRRVLLVEGHWLRDPGNYNYCIFADIFGDGLAPLAIFFYGPPEQYRRFSPLGIAAIKTVKWKARKMKIGSGT